MHFHQNREAHKPSSWNQLTGINCFGVVVDLEGEHRPSDLVLKKIKSQPTKEELTASAGLGTTIELLVRLNK